MKTAVLMLVLAAAIPAGAQETTTTQAPAASETKNTTTVKKAAPKDLGSPAAAGSPLVQAANRNKNRSKKDKKVITNETLKEMNQGRITTTNHQEALPEPPEPTEDEKRVAAEKSRVAETQRAASAKAAEQKKKDEAKKEAAVKADAIAEEELYLDADELPPGALATAEPGQPAKP